MGQSMKPVIDVSVVVPCYCCVDTIERAVESVASQTSKPIELILVNDASPDHTADCLQRLKDCYPDWIVVVNLTVNGGAGHARNEGWSIARGRYVAFLDSDDSWHPQKLAIQYAYMQANPDVCLSGHAHAIGSVTESEVLVSHHAEDVRWWRMLARNPFVTPSAMVRKEVLPRFQQGRRYMEDHLLWMEIALSNGRVVRLDVPLAILHKAQVGVAGLSSHIRAMSKADLGNYWLLYRKGLLGWTPLFCFWAWAFLKFLRRGVIFGIPRAFQRWRDAW
jgi:glycosyltransferase involved in cell wall biosynthesis